MQRSEATRWPISSDAVRPGDSMPTRFTQPGTRGRSPPARRSQPRRHRRPAAWAGCPPGRRRILRDDAWQVARRRCGERNRARGVDAVVAHAIDRLDVGPEAHRTVQLERDMHAEAGVIARRNRIHEVAHHRPLRRAQAKVAALDEALAVAPRVHVAAGERGHFVGVEPGGVDDARRGHAFLDARGIARCSAQPPASRSTATTRRRNAKSTLAAAHAT